MSVLKFDEEALDRTEPTTLRNENKVGNWHRFEPFTSTIFGQLNDQIE